jgi:K+-transporting ATPase ATPase C chain
MWRLALRLIERSVRATALFTLLTGLLYPLAVTGIAQTFFPNRASGALVSRGGYHVGSSLVGQPMTRPDAFHGRPSMTSDPATDDPSPYHAMNSSGSNLGPSSPDLAALVEARVVALRAEGDHLEAAVPVDLVTSSASGLDPEVSPAAALFQVPRIARARGVEEPALRDLIGAHTKAPLLGLFGAPRVNVLELNLALEAMDSHAPTADHDGLQSVRGGPRTP